ncbi:MAG: PhoH family protein [Erysipelotrichaceae bacterium]|nr:PhoH family protein [Erysipelotrichaceae bacterium]
MFKSIKLDLDYNDVMLFAGSMDKHIRLLSNLFNVQLELKNSELLIHSQDNQLINQITKAVYKIVDVIKDKHSLDSRDVIYYSRSVLNNSNVDPSKFNTKVVGRSITGKVIYPKTLGQYALVEALNNYDIVFTIGPAGTGKTYLSVVYAVNALKKGDIKRIILTRPAVEAGENLGFLPGDLKEKIDPYLRPIYDALYDCLGQEQTEKMIEKGVIEIAPLAYMRGRTLDDAYVILDEAQNTTKVQMKMFLTRLGFNSKMIVNGDLTQIDLSNNFICGLKEACNVLSTIEDIKFIYLTSDDVVRHPLVQKIIEAYDKY